MARILVIDDDPSLLQMINMMLKRSGHEIYVTIDSTEALELARLQRPDLVIVDVMMPRMSGYEVCKALRKDGATKSIPLLMLTSLSQAESRSHAEEAGADAFVTKPVTRDALVKHVDELIHTGARNFPHFTDQLRPVEDIPATTPVEAPPSPASDAATETGTYRARTGALRPLPLVVVVGLGSETGVTTIAINLALALMQYGRTCVIDLHNHGGQAATHLQLVPTGTWLNLLGFSGSSDKRLIGRALNMSHSSGAGLIASPPDAGHDGLSAMALHNLLATLAEGFARLIVDLPLKMDATSIAALKEANHIVLTLGNDQASLEAAPEMLSTLEALHLPGQIHAVLNHPRPQGITYETMLQSLNFPLVADIPYEPAQGGALSDGQPLVISQPDSLFARTLVHLAGLL